MLEKLGLLASVEELQLVNRKTLAPLNVECSLRYLAFAHHSFIFFHSRQSALHVSVFDAAALVLFHFVFVGRKIFAIFEGLVENVEVDRKNRCKVVKQDAFLEFALFMALELAVNVDAEDRGDTNKPTPPLKYHTPHR